MTETSHRPANQAGGVAPGLIDTEMAHVLPDEAIRALDRARDNPQAPAPQI